MGKGYRAMSASYVVLSTPHSRWIMTDSTGSARGGPGGWRVDRPRGTRPHPDDACATPNDEHDEARGRSRPERTRLYVRIGDDRERSQAKSVGVASYAFDDLLAEDAVGPNHQRQDHQDVRREVLRPAADVRINVARGHVLHDADDQPTEDRPRDRVEPARITTGKTLKPTSERCTSTPSMLPQITPPRAETTPVIAHASAKYRSTLIPIAIATCWLSATARIAIPLRDFRKNQPKTPRKTRLTDAPRSWIGGMNRGPTMNSSSLIGSARGFVSPPPPSGAPPRPVAARTHLPPTTAPMGRPLRGRTITRSSPNPNPTIPRRPADTASQSGAP